MEDGIDALEDVAEECDVIDAVEDGAKECDADNTMEDVAEECDTGDAVEDVAKECDAVNAVEDVAEECDAGKGTTWRNQTDECELVKKPSVSKHIYFLLIFEEKNSPNSSISKSTFPI